jgi:hypothetical protein
VRKLCEKMCGRLACYSREEASKKQKGRLCNMLPRQPSSKDPARKSWEAILGLRYWVGGGQQISLAFDCTRQEKRLMVTWVYTVQEVLKSASKGPKQQLLSRE